jgi:GTP-binding protein LepA
MDIERERGITIKAQTVRLNYKAQDGETYVLNLIDTPGHVDFAYEVNRSLAAVRGLAAGGRCASQGVEAQTLANVYHALDATTRSCPCSTRSTCPPPIPRVRQQIEDVIGLDASDALEISPRPARHRYRAGGHRHAPAAPKGDRRAAEGAAGRQLVRHLSRRRRADPRHRRHAEKGPEDPHDGHRRRPTSSTGSACSPPKLVRRRPSSAPARSASSPPRSRKWPIPASATPSPTTGSPPPGAARLQAGAARGVLRPVPGRCRRFRGAARGDGQAAPQRCQLFLRDGNSAALGFGFRCGFLGLLHLEIIQERLAREFDLDLIATAPSVVYEVALTDGSTIELHNPADMPDVMKIKEIREPWIKATILTPDEYLGSILKLCQDRRGIQRNLTYVGNRAMVEYDLPLNEVVFDFYDRLKSVSKGYASFDYNLADYREGDLVKLSILVNAEPVDALSMLVHRSAAEAAAGRCAKSSRS